ncbi:alpha-N-acetylgalactosaminide alpha-2,6-sialyltransferase 1-like [Trichomycterus rosablanca]|uniref:alpha-N-acetylgalactosaminide alpha-2,6-sialyltransferase 1-like n=1 Tax=Trichomycterus rosablanca TaxID=2290929 RepID=UPI002F35A3C0
MVDTTTREITENETKEAPQKHITSPKIRSYVRFDSLTAIPVLFKDNFTKLPKWEFEDIYVRSEEERRPVCTKSLQLSKDEDFQKATLWNIQLWLHEDHLDMNEWNRLAHFNNPFGFMEYHSNDIIPVADLIPKPIFPQMLAVPEDALDGCIRCAVVGTGGILNGSKMGKEIDSHHYVFRVNGAVIKGHEEDVGNRTDVYVHTSFSLSQGMITLKEYGFNRIPQDEGIIYVMIPEGLRDFEWLDGLLERKTVTRGSYAGYTPFSYYGDHLSEDRFYVLHPDFMRYIRNRFLKSESLESIYWHLFRPTNGAFALFLALHTCDEVNAYGFITEDYDKYNNYYYEKASKTEVVFYINHDYSLEIKTWKKLHDLGIIKLYQRKET